MNKNLFAILALTAGFISCTNLDMENPDATEEGWNKNPSTAVELSEDQPLSSSVEQASSIPEVSSANAPSSAQAPSSAGVSSSLKVSSSTKASSSSVAFSLWNRNTPFAQVQVPCTKTSLNPTEECQGWWFGATVGTGSSLNPAVTTDQSLLKFTSTVDGVVLPNGHMTVDGIKITLTAGQGQLDGVSYALIGFNWIEATKSINIASFYGLCLTYKLTGSPMELHLGWDESVYGYDTWFAKLPISNTPNTIKLTWGALTVTTGTVAESFTKGGWAVGTEKQPIATAVQKIQSLKFRLLNSTTTVKNATLEIYALGKGSECQ